MATALDIAIHKARIAAREAANIRAQSNEQVQRTASATKKRARKALDTELSTMEIPASKWAQQLDHAHKLHKALRLEKQTGHADIKSHGTLRFDISMANYLIVRVEAKRKLAVREERKLVDGLCTQVQLLDSSL